MRIAFLQDHLRNGGTESQTIHIADGLAQAGHEVTVIVFRKGGALESRASSAAFDLCFLKQGIFKTDWFAPGLKKLLKQISPDVLIPMGRMANCHAGLLLNSDRSYRLVSTFRTGKRIPFLYRKALRHSNQLVANSKHAIERIHLVYGINRPDDSSVIYNGCIRDFDTSVPSFRPGGKDNSPIRLVSVSMFRPEKRQIDLLRICSQLPKSVSWRLVLAGDGTEQAACIQEAETLGIANKVEFPGLLKDPRSLYYESDIAVHASTRESLPNFLVEAQMAGLPCVAYDVGGVSETFIHKKSGYLINPGDAAHFLDRIQILIESPSLRLQMSEAARDHAKANFSPKAQLKAYIELLKTLR
ncbi:MAG: glycosyltransferase [Verrucomicrobiota bacterium]